MSVPAIRWRILSKSRMKRQEAIIAWLFLLPTIIGYLWFAIGPLIYSLGLSFFSWDLQSPPKFVGLQNYHDAVFNQFPYSIWEALRNTMFYVLLVPVGIGINLTIALLCYKDTHLNRLFRSVVFLPSIVSAVAMTMVFGALFRPWGLINQALVNSGHSPLLVTDSPAYFVFVVFFIGTWAGFGGLSMLILVNALNNVPRALYEAASIEGAGFFQTFRKITFPLITPAIFFMIVTGMAGSIQSFVGQYMVLSFASQGEGSPASFGSDNVVASFLVYSNTPFLASNSGQGGLDMGLGLAFGFIIGLFVLIFIIANVVLQKKWVHYDLY